LENLVISVGFQKFCQKGRNSLEKAVASAGFQKGHLALFTFRGVSKSSLKVLKLQDFEPKSRQPKTQTSQ
jgi:hypothetical protein